MNGPLMGCGTGRDGVGMAGHAGRSRSECIRYTIKQSARAHCCVVYSMNVLTEKRE